VIRWFHGVGVRYCAWQSARHCWAAVDWWWVGAWLGPARPDPARRRYEPIMQEAGRVICTYRFQSDSTVRREGSFALRRRLNGRPNSVYGYGLRDQRAFMACYANTHHRLLGLHSCSKRELEEQWYVQMPRSEREEFYAAIRRVGFIGKCVADWWWRHRSVISDACEALNHLRYILTARKTVCIAK